MPSTDTREFNRALASLRRRRIAGLTLAALPAGLAAGTSLLLVAGAADAAYGFEPDALRLLRLAAGLAAAGTASAVIAAGVRRGLADTADHADGALSAGRREIRTALDLAALPEPPTGSLEEHLRSLGVREALARLAMLPLAARLPVRALRRAVSAAGAAGALAALAFALAPAPARIVASRFAHPDADIPPWTPWSFTVEPGDTEVFYGGDAELLVRLSGAKPDAPVYCVVRDPTDGRVEKSRAFDRGDGTYGYRIEKASKPLEYAFAAGRGRSVRHKLDVRLQPRVAEARVTITPPAYANLPEQSFPLGARDLAALDGSTVTLTVRSNRPLAGGELRITPVESFRARHRAVVDAQSVNGDTAVFRWTMKADARLALTLRDLRGTPSDSPLELEQKSLPDLAPEVALASPAARSLATPDTKIQIAGDARDDLGLDRFAFIRTLVGRDDRTEILATGLSGKDQSMSRVIDLGQLGVAAGQTLEFRLQATDKNPSKLGVATSAPAIVTIISEEKYAEILRDRATIEEFSARFATLEQAASEAKKSLDALEKAIESGDAKKIEEARLAAEKAHRDALAKLDALREDFPAFDLEKNLREQAYLASAAMNANLRTLAAMKPGADAKAKPDAKQALADMRQNLGANDGDRKKLAEDAARIAKAYPVMQMASRFREIYTEQTELATDIQKLLDAGNTGTLTAAQLDTHIRRQLRNRTALNEFRRDLSLTLADLPDDDPDFVTLRETGEKFLENLADPDPGEHMAVAAIAMEKERLAAAARAAETARSLLEALLKKPCDGFGKMCRNSCMKFEVKMPSAQDTMAQMLNSLCNKPGSGGKPGSGMGPGVGNGSGESAESWANLPIYGPSRHTFASLGRRGDGRGDGNGSGATVVRGGGTEASVSAKSAHDTVVDAHSAVRVPERYGDAVRRYFAPEAKPAPAKP